MAWSPEKIKEYRRQLQERGYCKCGRPPREGMKSCEKCAARMRAQYRRIVERGVCTSCRKSPAAKDHTMCEICLATVSARTRGWVAQKREKDLCSRCGTRPVVSISMCAECCGKKNEDRAAKRRAALAKYGGACVCCGETIWRLLTLDHKHSDGYLDRKEFKGAHSFFDKALKEDMYDRLQVMCMSCNAARAWNGGVCPHAEEADLLKLASTPLSELPAVIGTL